MNSKIEGFTVWCFTFCRGFLFFIRISQEIIVNISKRILDKKVFTIDKIQTFTYIERVIDNMKIECT
jgi:hypothetical protein